MHQEYVAVRVIVSGRVQMVMYRDFAQRKARSHGVVGTVRNLPDGTVEIIAEGPKHAMEAYLQKLRRGSILSVVEALDVTWVEALGTHTDFVILY